MRSDKAIVRSTGFGWTICCEMCRYRDVRADEADALAMAALHNRRNHP